MVGCAEISPSTSSTTPPPRGRNPQGLGQRHDSKGLAGWKTWLRIRLTLGNVGLPIRRSGQPATAVPAAFDCSTDRSSRSAEACPRSGQRDGQNKPPYYRVSGRLLLQGRNRSTIRIWI